MPGLTRRAAPAAALMSAVAVAVLVAGCTTQGVPTSNPRTSSAETSASAAVPPQTSAAATPPAAEPTPSGAPSTPAPPATPAGNPLDGVTLVVSVSGYLPDSRELVVAGYADVVGLGGTCTVTLSRTGAAPVTASVPATPDAATTSCSVSVPRSAVTPGPWSAVLTYATGGSSVTSAAATVEVPA